jgi:hypothetical protein
MLSIPADGALASEVAVIDTGIPSASSTPGYSFAGGPNPYSGHGAMMVRTIREYAPAGTSIVGYSCDVGGGVDLFCAAEALKSAADSGSEIASLSFTLHTNPASATVQIWQEALTYAQSKGMIVYASAGNGQGVGFPASLAGAVSVSNRAGQGGQVVGPESVWLGEIQGVGPSYATALAAALAAGKLAEGKEPLTNGSIPLEEELIQPVPTTHNDPVRPRPAHFDATYLRAKKILHLKIQGPKGLYLVRIGKKTHRTRAQTLRVKNSSAPRIIRIKAPGQAWKTVRVYRM